jgi:hypothetical protein
LRPQSSARSARQFFGGLGRTLVGTSSSAGGPVASTVRSCVRGGSTARPLPGWMIFAAADDADGADGCVAGTTGAARWVVSVIMRSRLLPRGRSRPGSWSRKHTREPRVAPGGPKSSPGRITVDGGVLCFQLRMMEPAEETVVPRRHLLSAAQSPMSRRSGLAPLPTLDKRVAQMRRSRPSGVAIVAPPPAVTAKLWPSTVTDPLSAGTSKKRCWPRAFVNVLSVRPEGFPGREKDPSFRSFALNGFA